MDAFQIDHRTRHSPFCAKLYGTLKSELDAAYSEVMSAGDLIDRGQLKSFETNLAKFVGTKYAIGLNSGYVMSGNVGSSRRLEYTAVGDTTNTAARIERMTKQTPYELLLSGSTRELLADDAELIYVAESPVEGRDATVSLWSVAEAYGGKGGPPVSEARRPAGAPAG